MGAGVDVEEARNGDGGPGEGGGGADVVLEVEWDWGESIAGEGDWSSVGVAGSTEGPGWTSASSSIAEASWCCGSLM